MADLRELRERASDLWVDLRFDGVNSEHADVRRHVDAIESALREERRLAFELAAKSIFFHALEMTAWMGLNEHKRVKYAEDLCSIIRNLAENSAEIK